MHLEMACIIDKFCHASWIFLGLSVFYDGVLISQVKLSIHLAMGRVGFCFRPT